MNNLINNIIVDERDIEFYLKETKYEISNLHCFRDAARLVIVILSSSHGQLQGVEELQGPLHTKNDVEKWYGN